MGALEKCASVQLRCEASLAADRCAELDCQLARVLEAKQSSELELLQLTSECEAWHKWHRDERPFIELPQPISASTMPRQSTFCRQSTYTSTMGRQSTCRSTTSKQSSKRFSWFWTSTPSPG